MPALMLPIPGMPDVPERERGDDRNRRRSWTATARRLVSEGWHPLMRTRARPDLGTCGGCVHRVVRNAGTSRPFPKCDVSRQTRGEQTDVRAWWPACDRFEPGDGISTDAARWTPEHSDRS